MMTRAKKHWFSVTDFRLQAAATPTYGKIYQQSTDASSLITSVGE